MNDGRYQAMSSIHLRGEYDYGSHVVLRGPTTEAAAMVHVHVHGDGLLTRGSRIGGRLESEDERATATTTRRRRRGRAKQ